MSTDTTAPRAPHVTVLAANVPAVGTAGNDAETIIGVAPYAGTIIGVEYVPASGITGADTNTRKVEVVNKGAEGDGTTVAAGVQFDSGTDAAAYASAEVGISQVAGAATVEAGDVLVWASTHVGTGKTDPGGLARVTIARAA